MKQILAIVLGIGLSTAAGQEGNLQPYLLHQVTTGNLTQVADQVAADLEAAGLQVLGRYQPAGDSLRLVLAITGDDLLAAVADGQPSAGFAAAMRVAVTQQEGRLVVSSQNPPYWANA